MSFELSECRDKLFWDQFVKNSPQGNIFCSTLFLDCLKIKYRLWLVKKDNNLHLGAVILEDESGECIRSPYLFSLYQGVLFERTYSTIKDYERVTDALEATEFLLAELEKKYHRISFCLYPDFEDLRSFSWFHYHQPGQGRFTVDLQYTGIMDLRSYVDIEGYLNVIRRDRRCDYRKAIKDGLEVVTSSDIDRLDYLHQLTFERQGIKRTKEKGQALRNIAAAALSAGFGELLLCKEKSGEIINAALNLYDAKYGYYLFAANHPEYRESGGGTLLMLENIRRCKERGLLGIDTCGINSPNRGDFKASLNAVPVPYFLVTWENPQK